MIVIILGIFAIANAEQIIKVSLGSVDVNVVAGNKVPAKYQPLAADDETVGANAKKWGTSLIEHAATGINGLPILDPFFKAELPPIPIEHTLISGKLKLKNLNITGIKDMNIKDVEVRLKKNRFDATVIDPALSAKADYEVDLNIGFLPVTYNGHISVWLKGFNTTAAASIVRKMYKGVAVYQLDGIETAVHVDNVKIAIEKIFWETVSGEMSTSEIWEQAATAAAEAFRTQANIILRKYPAKTVRQYLLGNVKPK